MANSITTGNLPNPPPTFPVPLGPLAPVGVYVTNPPPTPLSPTAYANYSRTSATGPGVWSQSATNAAARATYNFLIPSITFGVPDYVRLNVGVTINAIVTPQFSIWLPFDFDMVVDLWAYLYPVAQVPNGGAGLDSSLLLSLISYDFMYKVKTCLPN